MTVVSLTLTLTQSVLVGVKMSNEVAGISDLDRWAFFFSKTIIIMNKERVRLSLHADESSVKKNVDNILVDGFNKNK